MGRKEGMDMKYTTLLMDVDDTIFDFSACEYNALQNALEVHGLTFSCEVYHRFTAINSALWKKFEQNQITRSELRVRRFSELTEVCFPDYDQNETLADTYVQKLGEQAIFFDGARQAMEQLSRVYDIYIITNGLLTVQNSRLALSRLDHLVKGAFISDAMGVQKPMKTFFDRVLQEVAEKNTRRILVVGDSLTSDMQGGRNAGLDTCLYDPKHRVTLPHSLCDYQISNLNELLRNDEYA